MPRVSNKRERLLEAARALIYQQGYNQTTLADIARVSSVPLGNVYYYFKTKDEIASAVVDDYMRMLRARFQRWQQQLPPRQRLIAFIELIDSNREEVARYGCPHGSLCQELNKHRDDLAERADTMLHAQLEWVTEQFRMMRKKDAVDLAQQLMATLQGISLLANALNDSKVVKRQIRRLRRWLEAL